MYVLGCLFKCLSILWDCGKYSQPRTHLVDHHFKWCLSYISIHDFRRYDGRDEAGAARDGVHDGENVARVVGRDVRDRQLKS